MAQDSSMDIVSHFDFQEVRNAFDQTKREVAVRFDLKDLGIGLELSEEGIKITAPSEMSLNTAWDVLLQKMINRKLSPKILKRKDLEKIGGNQVRYEIQLIKTLDQVNAKKISQLIRDQFSKAKPSIQGDSVRVSSKSRDELQAVIAMLRQNEELSIPLDFNNFR